MSISERKEREKEHRRQEILKSAQEVFFQNGFDKTSMEMVAEHCQLAKGTLYLYFKSKEELYVSLVEDGIRILNDMMDTVIEQKISFAQKLSLMVNTYYQFTQTQKEHFAVFKMLDFGSLAGKVEQEKIVMIQQLRAVIFDKMKEVAALAKESGEFKTIHQPAEIVMMLWASTYGAIMMSGEKCHQLEMFKEVDQEKFVMRIAYGLIESFTTGISHETAIGHPEIEPLISKTQIQKKFV